MNAPKAPVQAQRWLFALLALCLPAISLSLANCKADEAPPGAAAEPGNGNGNGNKPDGGGATACDHDAPGCACALEGQHLVCGKVEAKLEKTTMCGAGISVCTNGKWGECILSNAAPIPVEDAPDGYYSTQGLGGATKCPNNPCDPYCVHYPDVPDPSLSDAGGNINAKDSGLETFPDAAAGPCTPKTCAQQGKNCGPVATGCGTTTNCGACTAPLTCGGGGVPSVCGKVATQACTPKTCAQLGKNCGPVGDECGGVLNCGTCTSPATCGGGGVASVCGVPTPPGGFCKPATCASLGKNCGPVGDGCGGLLQCGTCTGGQTCGGGGVASVCGLAGPTGGTCVPKTCGQLGKNCGPQSDGCGGLVQCGTCTSPQFCGGGNTPGVCGGNLCIPKTCTDLDKNCGPVADGCGGLLQCGTCQSPASCGGGGTPSKCGTNALCTGLCLKQLTCPSSGTTSITGTVYAPNGLDPVPNVIVYVPNAAVPAFSAGISCDNCAQVQGSPLVSTKTAIDGSFTITNMPVGSNIPLVIQIGRWRRQITIPTVAACSNTAIPATLTRFPRNKAEGDIPKLAVSTGQVDGMECVLRKMGVQDAEFTNPSGTGRIHFYAGGKDAGAWIGGNGYGASGTPYESTLLSSPGTLDNYDMILFPCQGQSFSYGTGTHASYQTNLADYVNAGGRMFATHYNWIWLYNDGGTYRSPLSGAFNWALNSTSPGNQTGYINTGFTRGAQLAQWLQLPAVGASAVYGQIGLNTIRRDYASVNTGTLNWLSLGNGVPVHATFDTPRASAPANQCGRVVFSDFHVYDASTGVQFPNECNNAAMTPQEKLLEYMLFDLASCVGNVAPAPPCAPITCASQGITCGNAGDGCGNQISCGAACPVITCTPKTCAQQGYSCGPAGDGCGGTINCGSCAAPAVCGSATTPNQCVQPLSCTKTTCASLGLACGPAGDGCGGTLDCGTCAAPLTCGGGGVQGQCGAPPACVPQTCPSPNVVCGQAGDGCGGTLNCGCTAPATCGGAGVPGKCGVQPACVPTTCAAQTISCGAAGDGCGGTLNCGACTLPQTCGGGNVPGQCGALTVYNDGYFVRDYEAQCAEGTTPYWQLWSWTAVTPGNSSIDFKIQTATTKAGLATAPADPLVFSNPPGPSALLDQTVKAHAVNQPAGSPDTQSGAALVDYTLKKVGRSRTSAFLRVTSHLAPTSDQSSGSVLSAWNMQIDCIPTE